jgi:outer membrane lipoprotein-sorting protein
MMNRPTLKFISLSFSLLLLSRSVRAEETRLDEVVQKVKTLDDAIEDETAHLLFRVVDETGRERKSTHLLYWLNAKGKEGLASRIMMVTLTPLNLRGEGYLIWEGKKYKDSQAWLYLPDLRQVRRVEVSMHHGKHGHDMRDMDMDEPESDLLFEEVTHRITGPGERSLVGEETLLGEPSVVIDQKSDPSEPSAKRRFWISPRNGTTRKIEYYDANGALLKIQMLDWQEIKGIWLWKRTEVRVPRSSRKTDIELTDLKVNTGLASSFFTQRTLLSGRLP